MPLNQNKVRVKTSSVHKWKLATCVAGVLAFNCHADAPKAEEPLGSYKAPYLKLERDPLEKDVYGGIDFWGEDRLNVPNYGECRNMLSNPSFEEGLRHYTFPPDIGTYQPGYEGKYSIDAKEGKFGRAALKIKTECPPGSFDCLQSFGHPVRNGASYTLSFYAKANKPGLRLEVAHIPANTYAKEQRPEASDSEFALSETWERLAIRIKSNSGGYAFALKSPDNVEGGAIWIDALQLEEGAEATEFVEKPASAALTTSAPGNFLAPGQKINAVLRLKTAGPNRKGTASVTAKDFFYNETRIGKFDFTTDSECGAEIELPLDAFAAGRKGVFILRSEIRLEDGTRSVDYSRLSVMDKMQGKHRNRSIFGYHQLVIPKHEAGLERWRDIGLGSTNYFFYNPHNPLLFSLLEKYGIEDVCALLRQHWDKSPEGASLTGNTISIQANGAADPNPEVLVKGMKFWDDVTPEREKAVEDAARRYAQYYRWRRNFAFHQEISNQMLSDGNYDALAKLLVACAKGVKAASKENKAFLEGGAANIMSGIALTDSLLSSCEKIAPGFKFDRFAVHAYGHPENEEFDDLLKRFLDVLDKHGYSDAPLYVNEGGYYSPFCIQEWGLTPYRPYLMDHYHLWGISYDMGWGERMSAALTARAWLLALKRQDRIRQFNMWRPFIYLDCDLTPMAAQKTANTLARLLGNASFKEEAVFAAKSKAYVFEDDDKTPIAAIWSYEDKVELGMKQAPMMEIRTDGGIAEALDIMENSFSVQPDQKTVELPLSPFPVFLKGKKGETAKLIEIVRGISVRGETPPPMHLTANVKDGKTLSLKVRNLLTKGFTGKLTIARQGESQGDYDIALSDREERSIDVKLRAPVSDSQVNMEKAAWTLESSDGRKFKEELALETLGVGKAKRTISLTGKLSDWDGIPYIPITNVKTKRKALGKDSGAGKGDDVRAKEFKARFKTAWDEKFFYLLVDVDDDKLFYGAPVTNSAQATDCDVLIAYFDTLRNGKDKNTLRVDSDDYYYVLMPRPKEGKALVYTQEACNQQLGLGVDAVKAKVFVPEVKTAFRERENGYFYEVAFPQWTLLPLQLKPGYVFGFGLFALDKDDEKDPGCALSLSYPPGSGCWRSAHCWPQAILQE